MKKVVTYQRVSTELQITNRQIDDIAVECKKQNYNIIASFEEKMSGTKKKRPELTAMLNFVKNNEVDYVMISEVSRLGRTHEILNTIGELSEKKVCLISLKESLKTLNEDGSINPTSMMVLGVLASLNSYDLTTIKYHQISGLKNAAKRGIANGGVNFPMGYKKHELTRQLIINYDEVDTVKLMFKMYSEGIRTHSIANKLNEQKITGRNGKKFFNTSVYKILTNPIVTGQRRYKGELFNFPELRIISDELYNEVQKLMKTNAQKQGINKKFNYLFDKKLIRCGICGKNYYGNKRSDGNANSYVCISSRYKGENCGNHGINIDKFENAVQNYLIDYFIDSVLVNRKKSNLNDDLLNLENDMIELEKELKSEINKEKRLVGLYVDEKINIDVYDERLKIITNEQTRINNLINEKNNYKIDIQKMIKTENNIDSITKDFKENGISKELLLKIINRIVITPAPEIKLSENKQDKCLKIDLYIGSVISSFWISQKAPEIKIDVENIFFNQHRFKLNVAYPNAKRLN